TETNRKSTNNEKVKQVVGQTCRVGLNRIRVLHGSGQALLLGDNFLEKNSAAQKRFTPMPDKVNGSEMLGIEKCPDYLSHQLRFHRLVIDTRFDEAVATAHIAGVGDFDYNRDLFFHASL